MRDSLIFTMLKQERDERAEDKHRMLVFLEFISIQLTVWEDILGSIPVLGKIILKKYRKKVEKKIKQSMTTK